MPFGEHHFDFKKIVRWFVKEEVKTPLSFFFKVIPYMTAAWLGVLYSPGLDSGTKFAIIRFSAWIFLTLSAMIAVFAFLRPKHLVYGESGHRAEKKLEFGTERKSYSLEEFEELPPSKNPHQLPSGEVPK
jgi:hypothetical protein